MSIQKPFQILLASVALAPLWFAIAAAEEAPLKLVLVVHAMLIVEPTKPFLIVVPPRFLIE